MANKVPGSATALTEKKKKDQLLTMLAEFSASSYTAETVVDYHESPPPKISLPEDMTPQQGAKVLTELAMSLAEKQDFKKVFHARPYDGAHALQQVLIKYFGSTGRGIPTKTFFGDIPPQYREIATGPGVTAQVPWGNVEVAIFEGVMTLGATRDKEYGLLFELTVNAPKRLAAPIHGLFNLIKEELEERSIYKGKAILGTDEPRFMNIKLNPTIVYNEDVQNGLETTVWGVIENADLLRKDNRRVNTRVLLHGPYGTGKSECGNNTAMVATDNGWTFIQFRSGEGSLADLENTMKTARLLAPAVVFIEDIDIYAKADDDAAQTLLTNLFDGLGSKQDDVMIVMTSNHAAHFSKAMLRAGRVDRMVEIGSLDRKATEKMVRLVIGNQRIDPATNFDKVWESLDGYEPAFVRQTFDQAAIAAIIRLKDRDYILSTDDFVTAANLLRPQHELHRDKAERESRPTVDTMIAEVVKETMTKEIQQVDSDGDPTGYGFGVIPASQRV